MAWLKKKNCARTTLNGAITAGAGSMVVTDATELPSTTDYLVTIWNKTVYADPCDDPNAEIVKVTNISGNVLTVTRAQEATVGVTHSSGSAVEQLITAGTFEELETAIDGKASTSHTHTEIDITDLDKYTQAEIDAFFEGESVGKKQVDWTNITNKPSLLTGDAADIGTEDSGVTVQDALNLVEGDLATHIANISNPHNVEADQVLTSTSGETVQDKLNDLQTNKANLSHTHTASQVTDFDTEVSNNTDVTDSFKKSTDDSDDITEGVTKLLLTTTERSKLSGIESNATADQIASEVPFTPNGDIASSDVQLAIQEVRDDADTKLSGKSDTGHIHDADDITTDQSGVSVQTSLNNKLDNIIEDTTPELGGELDAGEHTIGFTFKNNVTTTIDWRTSNKQSGTLSGGGSIALTFINPSNACNLLIVLEQSGSVGTGVTWPVSVKWPSGSDPTLSTADGAIDIISFFFDGTTYYGVASLDFS